MGNTLNSSFQGMLGALSQQMAPKADDASPEGVLRERAAYFRRQAEADREAAARYERMIPDLRASAERADQEAEVFEAALAKLRK